MDTNKTKSRDFVSDYEKIRGLLRDIFIYGCFNIDDFSRKGISERKYNEDIRRILNIIDSEVIDFQRINRKKAYYFRINMFDDTYNVLFDTYMSKTFTDLEVRLYLKLMQIFSHYPGYMKQREVEEKLNSLEKETPESITVYRRLEDLVKSGFLEKRKRQRINEYALAEDMFSELSEDEFNSLLQAVDFMRNTLYPAACGSFLHDTLKRYQLKRWSITDKKTYFYFKHNHFAHVLDDDVLWSLLKAVKYKREVSFLFHDSKSDVQYKQVRPVAFFADEVYGRRYLIAGIDDQTSQTKIFRLDKIKKVRIAKKTSGNWDEVCLADKVIVQKKQSLTGGCDGFNRKSVNVGLMVNKSLVKRLYDEIGELVISQQQMGDEQTVRLKLEMNDPKELKPFLRRYTGKLVIEASTEHELNEIMAEELIEWRKHYDII